jgi:GNAT superfamily N-acetyltransferase
MNLPDGCIARPLTLDDVDETVAMVNRCELIDLGELMWERADLLSDISVDGFDVDRDWIGVFDGPTIVAWAFLQGLRALWIDVAPEARGRGIGTALRRWAIDRARSRGNVRIGQTILDERTDVIDALRTDGFTPRHTSWIDAHEMWVDRLAVAATHRHRGIARALLATAFQRSFGRGYTYTALSTDSRTGALSLYEHVGMHVTRSFTHLARDL